VTLSLRITRRAATEIERADAWWRTHRELAPSAFRDDLQQALLAILRQPGIGVPVQDARLPDTRRLFVTRPRYHVFYRVRDAEIAILAVWHASRGQRPRV
jgi:plasmid stabilization system protein ParE